MRSLRLLHTMKICIFINNVTFHLYKTLHHIRLFMPVSSWMPLIFAICVAVAVLYAVLFAFACIIARERVSFVWLFVRLFVQFSIFLIVLALFLLPLLLFSTFFLSFEFHFLISQIHTRTFCFSSNSVSIDTLKNVGRTRLQKKWKCCSMFANFFFFVC